MLRLHSKSSFFEAKVRLNTFNKSSDGKKSISKKHKVDQSGAVDESILFCTFPVFIGI